MESFQRLESLIPFHREDLSPLTLSEPAVLSALKRFNPKKAAGPFGVPNWLLKEYEDILVCPVTAVLNSYCDAETSVIREDGPCYRHQQTSPSDLNLHMPLSSLSMSAMRFWRWLIQISIYGGIPASSSIHALMSMLHTWLQATRGSGTAVRVELFDYRKALVFFSFIPSNFGLP